MKRRSTAGRLHYGIAWLLIFGFFCLAACTGDSPAAAGEEGTVSTAASSSARDGEAETETKLHLPEASGTVVYEAEGVTIDASNVAQGYVMVKCESTQKRLKVKISTSAQAYYYDLPSDAGYCVYPLQMGNGRYSMRVMEQAEGDLYAVRYGVDIDVTLAEGTVPFVYPNQYVWFGALSDVVATADALAQDATDAAAVSDACYRFVLDHLTYDAQKAATVEAGYLSDADETLDSGTGICFDYSVLLAAMLRSQGIPARVVIGTVLPEQYYHAWNSVYIDGEWVWLDATLDGTAHREKDYVAERIY